MATGNERTLDDIVDRTRKLIALFDAFYDAPSGAHATIGLHCRDGAIIRTLQSWAAARGVEIRRTTLSLDPSYGRDLYAWDQLRISSADGYGELTVHDSASRRPIGEPVPANEDRSTADIEQMWSPAQVAS